MELQPGKYYPIVRQIPDPNDTATYYVRAVVRNATTGATIDTVDLTDAGSGRHVESWQVYANVPDDGIWVTITTTVYTDAGHTTKSAIYSEELEQYLIIPRIANFGGGGGGTNISYERIAELFTKAIKGLDKGDGAFKELKDLIVRSKNEVLKAIEEESNVSANAFSELSGVVRAIQPTDITPVLSKIAEIPRTDLTPIIEAVKMVHDKVPDPVDYSKLVGMPHADIFDAMEKRIFAEVRGLKAADRVAINELIAKINTKRDEYLSAFNELATFSKEVTDTEPARAASPGIRSIIRNARTRKV